MRNTAATKYRAQQRHVAVANARLEGGSKHNRLAAFPSEFRKVHCSLKAANYGGLQHERDAA
eukprot:CAMPEP_0119388864 /NCGR_PEP_ID=MMETSP1334-20130426/106826_1 /TAXON_ID=127549 /ORGANISM="Calcidiscus leptoporus, Strain RCC1130" /LENGTH=61 /DNA_ID=CAMNT_0007410967 /DNA_START=113 /DNA_END=295 /DNA_ORIENTATION=+